ncbi:tetratricopeptide repeat protein [Azospirillum griseum]|uniref:tetratricopeptide repeat protein n=1 Tax=Azospirillum griseum TaxID=2496639 RepID=UPI001FEBA375|nr:tetratricopeptide repeat protein [Azospirillum griseum]
MFSAFRKRVVIGLLLLIAATPILPGRSQTPPPMAQVEAVAEGSRARFVLRWPGSVRTEEVERHGRELTLRFSRPLGGVALDAVPGRLQGWVDNVQYGYDSVLLLLSADVSADVVADRSGVTVAFTREMTATRAAGAALADRVAQRRLDYFKALTLLEGGQTRQARALLRDKAQSGPRDAQSTALLAQAEERLGRWREAVAAYDAALDLTPNEPSLVLGKARLLYDNGDRARLDTDWQHVRAADVQRIQRLTGVMTLPGRSTIRYALENRLVDVDAVQRRDGTPAPFHGLRQRMEFTLSHDWPELERTDLTFYAARRVLGVGVTHGWKGDESETRIGAAWNEPTFAFLEGIVSAGRRDRLFVQHEARLSDRWNLTLGAGYNRYGLAGDADLARSGSVEASLRYVLNREGPLTSLVYALDAEYVGRRVQRARALPAPQALADDAVPPPLPTLSFFAPVPVATREVHAVLLSVEDWLADYVRYSAQIGYAYDRRGKSGPQGAVSLVWEPLDALEIGLRASHARSTARGTASAVNAAGGYLMWRY